ncbi:copper resistance protein CopD [Mycolicibacterium sp. 018/SC-01/001]|uniref:CopD family protein n=1 Tax=Mycolicibacterium sp. 018/SC-01/001 TaxID=2592069 RepID=UPI00117BE931|nr:CopD family protein [Mycolicibacterium sp. 018/SC-01/001]TRW88922.1 copper resistance protein CopD [Mycolicibacterium sp. 018/SC-01/001]
MTHARAVAGGLLVTAAACVLAWALAFPGASLSAALVRAMADAAAVVTVGLAAVPALDGPRYRDELLRRATAPLLAASAVWLAAELVRLVLATAEAAGRGVAQVGLRTVWDFSVLTAPGRAALVTIAAAAAVCLAAGLAPRTVPAAAVTVGTAAIGVVGHPLTGHLGEDALGGVAVAVHTLAAALWCGVLAALVLTVTHRGQWARVLPRFSALSLASVGVLLVGGVAASMAMLASPGQLVTTDWGRVLCAKLALTAALLVLAWRNRASWLPDARAHRSSAGFSRARAYTELALMATTLAAAATLAVTG